MRVRKLITLVVEYDDREYDHPSEWDWAITLDMPAEDVHRVEVYDAGTPHRLL